MNLAARITAPDRPLSPGATEYVTISVTAQGRLTAGHDPAADPDLSGTPVAVACRAADAAQDLASPEPGDWTAVSWVDAGPGCGTVSVLAGPHGVIRPAPGQNYLWLEITCPPEVAVIRVSTLLVIR